MGFDTYSCNLIRKKWQKEHKSFIGLRENETLPSELLKDRACLRIITRVNGVFLTKEEQTQLHHLRSKQCDS